MTMSTMRRLLEADSTVAARLGARFVKVDEHLRMA